MGQHCEDAPVIILALRNADLALARNTPLE